ncbi:MAG: glycosyltransferase [Thermoplasmata archaeon]
MGSPAPIALVHDARRFDGIRHGYELYRRALEAAGHPPVGYTCADPSLADEYPRDGTMVWGRRIPLGGDVERAFNRWFPVFTRQLAGIPASIVHVLDVHLASLTRYRDDVVVEIHDLAKRTTRWYPRANSLVHNHGLKYLPRARAVVCHTEWVRQDIRRTLDYPPERTFVVPHYSPFPEPPPRSPEPPTPERPWNLLDVSTDRPHKNIELFLQLMRAAGDRFRGTLVTSPTPKTRRRIRELGLERRLTVVTDLPDLLPVYRSAEILVFPSFYEGFGIPLVEAMGQGLPVLASNRTCIGEVVGAAAPVLDPATLDPWLKELDRLSDPVRWREASRRSFDRAREFGPERTAAALIRTYRADPSRGR